MHEFGWSRQQAIDLMKENTAKTENDIVVEVDRYIVWPAQALAYKIGELKIKELKARARRELKERFDLRTFHNALLDDGPLPLDVLEKRIGEWISEQQGKKR
jgi:prolyl oligopeptidase